MSDPSSDRRFPPGALAGAAVMIGLTLVLVTVVRLSGMDISQMPPAKPVFVRELKFADLPDGGVAVYDTHRAEPVQVLPPGTNGFVRATMRILAHERRHNGISAAAPFRLAASEDGRLILEDPTTGRRIDLEAFGATNAAVFAGFLGANP